MHAERLEDGLWWSTGQDTGMLSVGEEGRADPVFHVRRAPGCVRADAFLFAGGRPVDLSSRPAALVGIVRSRVRGDRGDGDCFESIAERLSRLGTQWGVWPPTLAGTPCPLTALGAITHPVLGLAYAAGTQPAPEVPVWASPALSCRDLPSAARRAFGPKATRPVVRALGRCLSSVPPGSDEDGREIAWWAFGIALAACPVLEPDHVAAVLTAPTDSDARPPERDELHDVRTALTHLGPETAGRLVVDGLTRGGGRTLVGVLRTYLLVRRDLGEPVPRSVAGLERACLDIARIDPGPGATYPNRSTVPPRETSGSPSFDPALAVARAAPQVRRRVVPSRFAYPEGVSRLSGSRVGDLTLALPWNAYELGVWGRLLSNCLGTFDRAVAAGKSVIIGIRHRRHLLAAAELRPGSRSVVQFLGSHNRPVPESITDPVMAHLHASGLIL